MPLWRAQSGRGQLLADCRPSRYRERQLHAQLLTPLFIPRKGEVGAAGEAQSAPTTHRCAEKAQLEAWRREGGGWRRNGQIAGRNQLAAGRRCNTYDTAQHSTPCKGHLALRRRADPHLPQATRSP